MPGNRALRDVGQGHQSYQRSKKAGAIAASAAATCKARMAAPCRGNRGTVYHADGTAPFRGLIIYLYQTDASGVYNHANRGWREPRLRGWLKTGDRGAYEIQTIKPGSYPGSRNPAHIHAIVRLPGDAQEWIDDFLFDGDPFLADQQQQESLKKGKFANIMKLTRSLESHLSHLAADRILVGTHVALRCLNIRVAHDGFEDIR